MIDLVAGTGIVIESVHQTEVTMTAGDLKIVAIETDDQILIVGHLQN